MASVDVEEIRASFKAKNQTAFVLGYTGETGKALTKQLLETGVFSRVTLIGRRVVEFKDDLYKDVEQKVIDFDKLEDHKEAFEGYDQGFSCLGTTRHKSGADGFYKVDHDYVVNTAKLAKEGGCKGFHLVTAQGSNAEASVLYYKTKGEAENEIKEMGFDRFSIYQPGVIMVSRQELRIGEAVLRTLMKPVDYFLPGKISNQVKDIARAMLYQACKEVHDKVEIVDSKLITEYGRYGLKK